MQNIIRFIGDNHDNALSFFRNVFFWVSQYANRYEILFEPSIYSDDQLIESLNFLGEEKIDKMVEMNEKIGVHYQKIVGGKMKSLVDLVKSKASPEKAVSGDLSPVIDIKLFDKDTCIFFVQDYGRVYLLNVNSKRLEKLKLFLLERGFLCEEFEILELG